jgi:hypothetical protein
VRRGEARRGERNYPGRKELPKDEMLDEFRKRHGPEKQDWR